MTITRKPSFAFLLILLSSCANRAPAPLPEKVADVALSPVVSPQDTAEISTPLDTVEVPAVASDSVGESPEGIVEEQFSRGVAATDSEDPRDAPFHQSFSDPKAGCKQLTVIVQVPTTGSVFQGHPGHVAVGIDNQLFDYGPRIHNQGKKTLFGVAASKFLTTFVQEKIWNKKQKNDFTVEEAFQTLQSLSGKGDHYTVWIYTVGITRDQARKVKDFWTDLYKRMDADIQREIEATAHGDEYKPSEVYLALSRQCTTVVNDSLVQAGIFNSPRGITRILPVSKRALATQYKAPP